MLTNNVISIPLEDWILMRELRGSLKYMQENIDKHKIYSFAINKEKEVYEKTRRKYV